MHSIGPIRLTCIRIGFGHIAKIHEEKFHLLGVKTIGFIEPSQEKQSRIADLDYSVLQDYRQASRLEPDFWDVCSSTSTHVQVLGDIIRENPSANILVEKPICTLSQVESLRKLLRDFHGKITVNENYCASEVTNVVRKRVRRMNLTPSRVISEMTKNRTRDIVNGRFLDEEHYAFGYEGSHMIVNILELGSGFLPLGPSCRSYDDMYIERPDMPYPVVLAKQGVSEKRYIAENGAQVILYTAMDGNIGYYYPGPHTHGYIPEDDARTRYRILSVEDETRDIAVIGFYEPLPDTARNLGKVVILRKRRIEREIGMIVDDTMYRALQRALDFFRGKGINPYSVDQAIRNLEFLKLWENPPV